MRRRTFVDSSAWYALADSNDSNHAEAVRLLQQMVQEGSALVTTNHVIAESYTLVRGRLGGQAALALLQQFRTSSVVQRIFATAEWEEAAEELLARYSDQSFSYVDAVSFITMSRLRIREAFAFDHHFLIAGFDLVRGKQ